MTWGLEEGRGRWCDNIRRRPGEGREEMML